MRLTIMDAEAWLKRMAAIQATGTALQFVVAEKRTGRAIGTCLLFGFDEPSARAELGFVLGRAHWAKGYMTEALATLIDCAFVVGGSTRARARMPSCTACCAANGGRRFILSRSRHASVAPRTTRQSASFFS